jgi:hypothetical protein
MNAPINTFACNPYGGGVEIRAAATKRMPVFCPGSVADTAAGETSHDRPASTAFTLDTGLLFFSTYSSRMYMAYQKRVFGTFCGDIQAWLAPL